MSSHESSPPQGPELKNQLKASYDSIAQRYNEWTADSHPRRLKWLNKLLPQIARGEHSSVLELGCGAGLPSVKKMLTYPNLHVTANDLSETQLELARQNLVNDGIDRVTFVQGDMLALEFQEASFDAVVAFYSIIHLPRDEQVELIGKIVKWMKPGGLLLATFSAEEIPQATVQEWLDQKGGWMFWSGWGAEKTRQLLKEAGLEELESAIEKDVVDASFLWVISRKKDAESSTT